MYGTRSPRWLRLSPGFLLCLGLAACSGGDDGTGPDDNGQGSFNATVSGAVSGTFSGFAYQSGTIIDSSTNESGWVLYLGTTAGAGNAVYVIRQGDRPGNGSYSFVDLSDNGNLQNGEFGAIATVAIPGGQVFAGFSSGGTLTITSSSGERVQGSFTFQITGIDPISHLEVVATVSGNFNAVNSNFVFPGF